MVEVLSKNKVAEGVFYIMLKTPEMSKKTRPGQYILIKKTADSPTVPVFVAEKDKKGIGILIDVNTKHGSELLN